MFGLEWVKEGGARGMVLTYRCKRDVDAEIQTLLLSVTVGRVLLELVKRIDAPC